MVGVPAIHDCDSINFHCKYIIVNLRLAPEVVSDKQQVDDAILDTGGGRRF